MYKSLNLKAAISGALCCALAAQSAAAQNASNSQLLNAGLREQFNAADISQMMSEFTIQTQLAPYEGNETATVMAATAGGARFLITMFHCDDAASGHGCRGAAVFTALSNAGVAYDDINTFNSGANVTRAVNISEQNIIVFGTQIFFSGGIGRENFKFVTELFLADMQSYIEAVAAVGTTVSMKLKQDKAGKVDNVVQAEDNAILPSASKIGYSLEHAKSAAISNTWKVSFAPEAD